MNLEDKLHECDELYYELDFKGLIEKCDEILEEFPDNQNAMGYQSVFSRYRIAHRTFVHTTYLRKHVHW